MGCLLSVSDGTDKPILVDEEDVENDEEQIPFCKLKSDIPPPCLEKVDFINEETTDERPIQYFQEIAVAPVEMSDTVTLQASKNPTIVLYEHDDFEGRSVRVTSDTDLLTNLGFNDTASSAIVESGVWMLYQHSYYNGKAVVVWQGERIKSLRHHDFNDTASSLKSFSVDVSDNPEITLYQHSDYRGKNLTLSANAANLKWFDFNDTVSSIKVNAGTWVGYRDANYGGSSTLFRQGNHNMNATGGQFYNDSYSSFKILKVVSVSPIEVVRMDYQLDKGTVLAKPDELFTWSQVNDTSLEQALNISKEISVTREETYEFRWNQGASLTVSYELQTGVPKVGFGKKLTVSATAFYDIGATEGSKTANTEKWTIAFPSKIKARTKIELRSTVQEGKCEVPFTAVLRQDGRTWTESGVFKGVNFYEYDTKFTETPLS